MTLSLADCRRIEPSLQGMPDEDALRIRDALTELARLALESYEEYSVPTSL